MSLFSSVREKAAADLEAAWTKIKGFFSADIEPALKTFLQVIESNGGSDLLKIALQVIAVAETGAPWDTLVSRAKSAATAAGIQTTYLAVSSALQVAQTSLQATLASEGVASITTIPAAPPAAAQSIVAATGTGATTAGPVTAAGGTPASSLVSSKAGFSSEGGSASSEK
jgi:hypothetical protein